MSATLRLLSSALAVSLLFWIVPAARAADDSGRDEPGAGAGENSAKAEAPPQDARNGKSLREQDIYIPYDKLRQVFERHGRGVFLPYEEFEALWRAAQEKTRPAAGVRPPVGAVITEIENEATVAKDVVRVKATVKIDLLAEGWHEIPLRLADAAITAATLGGEPARIVGGPGEDYRLLVEKKGKQPEQIVLSLEYAKAISKMPGQNSVSFQAPQAPVSRWRVRIPQAGVKVNLHPLIAATEVPAAAAAPGRQDRQAGRSRSPPPTKPWCWPSSARRRWSASTGPPRPRAPPAWPPWSASRPNSRCGSTRGPPAAASTSPTPSAAPNWANWPSRCRPTIRWSTSSTPTCGSGRSSPWPPGPRRRRSPPSFSSPPKRSSRSSSSWRNSPARSCRPRRPSRSSRPWTWAASKASWSSRWRPGSAPKPPRASGLLQVDAAELPDALRRQPWTFSYRYATVPYELVLGVEELQPRVTADSLVEARLEPERLTLDVTAVYNIERAGIFKLELDVPPDFALRHVRGCDLPGDAATRRSPPRSTPTTSKARTRTAWWSTFPTRPWAASPWTSNCRRTCRSRSC